MKIFIYLFLFLSIICTDIPKPSKYIRNCFEKSLGKKGFKILYNSFKEYHSSNGVANFTDFIKAERPELNPMLGKCMKKDGRKLSKKRFLEELKTKNVKQDMIKEVKNGNEETAKTICVNALNKKKFCEKFVEKLVKKYKKTNK